jgi:hypothetical protein
LLISELETLSVHFERMDGHQLEKFCFTRNSGFNGIQRIMQHGNNIFANIAGNNQKHNVIADTQVPVVGNFNEYLYYSGLLFICFDDMSQFIIINGNR